MDKQNLLNILKSEIASGNISATEIENIISQNREVNAPLNRDRSQVDFTSSWNIIQVLYVVGGLIIFSGIAWLLSENWEVFGIGLRLLFTFGTSIIFLISGKILADNINENKQLSSLSLVSILISFLTFPVGVGVAMDYFGFSLDRPLNILVYSLMILVYYITVHILLKYDVSLIFLIISSLITYFSLASYVLEGIDSVTSGYLFAVSTGVGFVLFGIWVSRHLKGIFEIGFLNLLTHILFQGIGLIAIFSFMFSLSGSEKYPIGFSEYFWEIIFLPVVIIVIYLSNKLKSNVLLVVGGVFLLAYIIKVVFRYLSETPLGTPGALLLAGVLVIITSFLLLKYRGGVK